MSVQFALSNVLCGVPQGSHLIITARQSGVGFHFCVDDTQLQLSLDVGNESKVPYHW